LPPDDRKREEVKDQDIAEMAFASFNIHGALACARSLRGWTPRAVSYRVGKILAGRFLDHGRYQDVDDLAVAGKNDVYLILAITEELRAVNRNPPREVVERALRLLLNPKVKIEITDGWNGKESLLSTATALVEASHKLGLSDHDTLAGLLTRHLPATPSRALSSRFAEWRVPHLRAYCLRAALAGEPLQLIDLADPDLRKELEKENRHHHSRDAQEFNETIGSLLPWHMLRAKLFVKPIARDQLADALATAKSASATAERTSFRETSVTSDEIACLWFEMLVEAGSADPASIKSFDKWVAELQRPLYTPTLRRLARLAALDGATHPHALAYANQAFTLTRDERADAESKASEYIDVARSILTVSASEAASYFSEAVEVASKIGDENLSRWTAILDLADRAARKDRPAPQAAYRLSRCAELTYDYVVRDKHFDWASSVRSIAGLCPSSSLAILSRWRDRNFGWVARLLPVAVEFLVARGSLDPKVALALVGFRAHWDGVPLLKSSLDASAGKAEKTAIAAFLYRYMSLERQSAQTWREMKAALAVHGIAQPGLDDLIAFSEREEHLREAHRKENASPFSVSSKDERERDWDGVFSALDLSVANDVAEAYRRFRAGDPPYYQELFFREAFVRIQTGKEAEFVAAMSEIPKFDLYDLRSMLEQIPEAWKSRLAVKSALAATLKTFCRRFCMAVTKSRYYEVLPFKLACELSGVAEGDVLDVVLTAVGDAPDLVGADRLFALVGLLASKLSEDEALEALSFGLDLFEVVLENKDGDGPWSDALAASVNSESSVAGYIWAGLAAPRASVRWEAAHAVRALCLLGQKQAVTELVALAKGTTGGPYADARLHFYYLHARQWLLIALARAAKHSPDSVVPHADFLTETALGSDRHILMRKFAAEAVLALMDAGVLKDSPELRTPLAAVNASPFPLTSSKAYDHIAHRKKDDPPQNDNDRYFFGMDFEQWLSTLGRCFDKSPNDIERRAMSVIRDDWHYVGSGQWDEDERARRKIYKEGETYHSNGSYPRSDHLRFYLCYHAMMIVAGRLLASTPLHQDPDGFEEEFADWLSGHDLARLDRNWLADRRDPVPLEWLDWKDEARTENWRWSLARGDFDRVLISPDGRINVWGRWSALSGTREESVHVSSALVSKERSAALLRALQTSSNPHDYKIPDADDDRMQLDTDGFQLKGWVIDRDRSGGLDDRDPWAGEIRFPPPSPAHYAVDLMKLEPDTDRRTWRGDDRHAVMWAQVWGHFREKDEEDEGHETGQRLQASPAFIVEFLRKMDMELIVEVEIERRSRRARYERLEDDNVGFIPASARLFLLRADGSFASL
jgi:hypothetical protein